MPGCSEHVLQDARSILKPRVKQNDLRSSSRGARPIRENRHLTCRWSGLRPLVCPSGTMSCAAGKAAQLQTLDAVARTRRNRARSIQIWVQIPRQSRDAASVARGPVVGQSLPSRLVARCLHHEWKTPGRVEHPHDAEVGGCVSSGSASVLFGAVIRRFELESRPS